MLVKSAVPLVLLALVAGATFAAGCSGCDKPGDQAATDAALATPVAPAASSAVLADADAGDGGDETARRPMPMRRGMSGQLFVAARTLGLPADTQKKVDEAEKIGSGPPDPALRDVTKDLHAELVSQVKAGKIESSKLEPKYAAIDKASAAERDKDAEALDALHAALDPAQRKSLVAAVRAQQAKREEHMGRRDGGAPDAGGKGDAQGMAKRSLDRMLRGLELDPDQQKKVDALATKDDGKAHDPAEMKKRSDALLDAFEKEKFEAKKLEPDATKRARAGLEEESKLLEKLLPILKPEQREKLAARMDHGPSPHGRRPGFGHRPGLEEEEGPE
ncbi:MAG: hypothetical protein JWP97_1335 [Labilithrix sp.]|nr:hypothetical protein [Labilithrix sp.]